MSARHKIIRLIAGLFLAVAFTSAAHASPVSIRCAGAADKDPYFVTYDIQSNRFILETPVGNLLKGQITNTTDESLELRFNAMGGPVLLVFGRKASVMQWPGMPAREFGRAPLNHACKSTADRTVLSLFSGPNELERRTPVDAFSIRCQGTFLDFFITMDRATKTVVQESEGGNTLSGDIAGIDGDKISFSVGRTGRTLASGIWDQKTQELSRNDPPQPPHSQKCAQEKARSIMEVYGR